MNPRPSGAFRIAVLNDLHAQFTAAAAAGQAYPGANARARWLLAQFAPGGELADADCALAAGDLIHGENLATIAAEHAALAEQLARLPVPFLPCCGNHEVRQQEGDAAHEAAYRRTFGGDRVDYRVAAGPCDLVVINNAGSFHVGAARREERWRRLRALLAERPGVPKILVCHIPLVAVRDEAVLRESFGFLTWRALEGELLDTLDDHGSDVRLVVSGHLHLTGMVRRRGVPHLVVCGTASWPHDYAVIDVTPQAIAVEVRSLPRALHEPATNLHGPPRYRRAYRDHRHPDGASYLSGRPGERRFRVPLQPEEAA